MKTRQASVLVFATVLLVWHGMMLSVPHNHADPGIPQEELACSASSPSSQTNHLHSSGHLLTPHPCAACLASSNAADVLGTAMVEGAVHAPGNRDAASFNLQSQNHPHLPLKRGPPLAV